MSKKVRLIICGISAVVLAVLLGVLVFQKNAKDENLAAQPESVATNDVIGMETQTKEQAEEGISLQDSNTYLIDSMDITYISLSNNGITVNGSGASVSSEGVKIEKAGNYEITGTLSEGQIKVNAWDVGIVVLTLNDVKLTCRS